MWVTIAGNYTNVLTNAISSAIGKYLKNNHGIKTICDLTNNFSVIKKCNGKLDCLIYEMLFIKKKNPSLNMQSDSIGAKLFV